MIGYNTFVKLAIITVLQVADFIWGYVRYGGPLKY